MLTKDLLQAAKIISAQFSEPVDLETTTYRDYPAIIIKRVASYSEPEYTGEDGLVGMLTLFQNALGANQVDEYGKVSETGCSTCDWGSLYGTEYVAWYQERKS